MLETDYLIIGSGAVGMAFADTLLDQTDANIIIVDKYAKPGGHWNYAYPFVTLHQPSQFYGVSSQELSDGLINKFGLNKGLHSLATGAQISEYYEDVMQNRFLPTGRVQYFPNCEYQGNGSFESNLTGDKHQVKVNKKLVDCTFLKSNIPATHTPNFSVDEGVQFMPINDLVSISKQPEGYVIIGGGKTGIDACLWLLEHQVDPDHITWIVSRDAWLLDRQNTQPSMQFFDKSFGAVANQTEAAAKASSISDLFDRLESTGVLLRLDKNVKPTMFHGATVSHLELEELRKIKKVVRMGHVQRINKDEIILEKGTIPTSEHHIHVDCSASAISHFNQKPIFEEGKITPQTVRSYQPIFSASVIAYVEANYKNDSKKNSICQIVPIPNKDTSWITMTLAQMTNQLNWARDKKLRSWLAANRLDGFGALARKLDKNNEHQMGVMAKIRNNGMAAMMNLQSFVTELNEQKHQQIENPQFQVNQKVFFNNQIENIPESDLEIVEGELLVKVEKFAYTSNNITYAVAGDMIGYWKFFPPAGDMPDGWGVIPVWGFGEVVQSNVEEIAIGERLFGYFPPAKYLKMKAGKISQSSFMDSSQHRLPLPAGYNRYRRVDNEENYQKSLDSEIMLLFPLHLTSFCLWDALKEKHWHGAEQILILSASSKTSTGLGYALKFDDDTPKVIGITSQRNLDAVKQLNLYDESLSYEKVNEVDASLPTVIVDMSGNNKVLAQLHKHLADNMKFTSNVGLTHWENARPQPGIISERSEFFFAPGHIQKRMKDWGPKGFEEKTSDFMRQAAMKTRAWLQIKEIHGLAELAKIHPRVCRGDIPANEGLIVVV